MTYRWIITGATSPISEAFAHLVAKDHHPILLVGRNRLKLESIQQNLSIRYNIPVTIIQLDFNQDALDPLLLAMEQTPSYLFLGHSLQKNNNELNEAILSAMMKTNIESMLSIIFHYLHLKQPKHGMIYISSVAADIGRNKNSFYGATKGAISTYLEGIQQKAHPKTVITIAKLGMIDTPSTDSIDFPFKACPKKTAQALYSAFKHKKRVMTYPRFWYFIMKVIKTVPFVVFKKFNF